MYRIVEKQALGANTYSMKINAPRVAAKTRPGQFIILRVDEDGERIPLTVADTDPEQGTVRIMFQAVGLSTRLLAQKEAGESISDFLGPLGQPSHLPESGRVICVGGGVGTAVVYPQVKELSRRGVWVDVIIGARSADLLILEKEIGSLCNRLFITTDDGTKGRKGLVTDVLRELLSSGEPYEEVIAIGPPIMMKFVSLLTKEFNVKTTVSMNPIMVDGTGMCGGCRVLVDGKTKYACVDGPEFNGHQVDFDDLMKRLGTYRSEEARALDVHQCKLTGVR